MKWLIAPGDLEAAATRHEYLLSLATRSLAQLAEDLGMDGEQVAAAQAAARLGPDLSVRDGVATVPVRGVLLDGPSWLYDLLGVDYSHYEGIVDQVVRANEDPRVQSIVLDVDSPGGLVRGVFGAADAIYGSAKPVSARVSGMAASAAYLLASQAKTIEATGRADEIGSIGVAQDMYVSPNVVSVASSGAPNKRPDVRTDAGRAVVRAELDEVHDLFVAAVARGRGVSDGVVRDRFGRGGILLAGNALAVGMIDTLSDTGGQIAPVGGTIQNMDLAALRKDHPDIYAAAFADGIQAERERVLEHLRLGEESGATGVAVAAIRGGEGFSPGLLLQHAKAALAGGSAAIGAREAAAPPARGPDASADPASRQDGMIQQVFAMAAEKLGVELRGAQ